MTNHNDRGETDHTAIDVRTGHDELLPEWSDSEVDDETWIAALEASRRRQFAELAEL